MRYRRLVTDRRLETAELIAVGSELTTGETRDTHGGDLARGLTALGVVVGRLSALPDVLADVVAALRDAISRSDLVITTGGLGPTPDDLTREAIAAVLDREPREDPDLLAWLRDRFERRGAPMAEANRKQAWLIEGATSLPNPNGSAPGWWVERPDGGLIVALPGPPRELHPMWRDEVLPRLAARGLGADRASHTLRLTGVGESNLVEIIGEARLRALNPVIATYAREDAVDVRVSARAEVPTVGAGRAAAQLVAETITDLEVLLAPYIFARDEERWPEALAQRLVGRSVAAVEIGTDGSLAALIGGAPFLRFLELVAPGTPIDAAHGEGVDAYAAQVRLIAGADIGLAVRARERDGDTAVTIAIAIGDETHRVTRTAFLGGPIGRRRAAVLACAELWRVLGEAG